MHPLVVRTHKNTSSLRLISEIIDRWTSSANFFFASQTNVIINKSGFSHLFFRYSLSSRGDCSAQKSSLRFMISAPTPASVRRHLLYCGDQHLLQCGDQHLLQCGDTSEKIYMVRDMVISISHRSPLFSLNAHACLLLQRGLFICGDQTTNK